MCMRPTATSWRGYLRCAVTAKAAVALLIVSVTPAADSSLSLSMSPVIDRRPPAPAVTRIEPVVVLSSRSWTTSELP